MAENRKWASEQLQAISLLDFTMIGTVHVPVDRRRGSMDRWILRTRKITPNLLAYQDGLVSSISKFRNGIVFLRRYAAYCLHLTLSLSALPSTTNTYASHAQQDGTSGNSREMPKCTLGATSCCVIVCTIDQHHDNSHASLLTLLIGGASIANQTRGFSAFSPRLRLSSACLTPFDHLDMPRNAAIALIYARTRLQYVVPTTHCAIEVLYLQQEP